MSENHLPRGLGYDRVRSDEPFQNDRARIARARQAAEALFAPRRQVTEPSISAQPPAQMPDVPRVIAAVSPPPIAEETVPVPIISEQPVISAIPPSQVARIRTWRKYGMTIPQVAEACGLPLREIERLLRKA